jgi:hypothetical protein
VPILEAQLVGIAAVNPGSRYFGLPIETISLLIDVSVGLMVFVGVLGGLAQLRHMARQSTFTSVRAFHEILQQHAALFDYVSWECPFGANVSDIHLLDASDRQKAARAIDALNLIAHLVEENLVDARLFFGLSHVTAVRVAHILDPFMRDVELSQGAPYGHRVQRIAVRAKRFHLLNPATRTSAISVTRSGEVIVIVNPVVDRGAFRRTLDNLEYRFRLYARRF